MATAETITYVRKDILAFGDAPSAARASFEWGSGPGPFPPPAWAVGPTAANADAAAALPALFLVRSAMPTAVADESSVTIAADTAAWIEYHRRLQRALRRVGSASSN